jgi:hypothetical protein
MSCAVEDDNRIGYIGNNGILVGYEHVGRLHPFPCAFRPSPSFVDIFAHGFHGDGLFTLSTAISLPSISLLAKDSHKYASRILTSLHNQHRHHHHKWLQSHQPCTMQENQRRFWSLSVSIPKPQTGGSKQLSAKKGDIAHDPCCI